MNATTNMPSFDNIEDTSAPTSAQATILPALSVEVFADYQQSHYEIRNALRHNAFSRFSVRFRDGGLNGALDAYKNERSPELLVIESDEEQDILIERLRELAEYCGEDTRVLLIGGGAEDEIEIYRSIRKLGVSDYLPAPIDASQLILAIQDIFSDVSQIKLGRVTAFIGCGGGTGSSTVAQAVAAAISRVLGSETILADLDPQYGTVGLNFGISDAYTLTDALRRDSTIDEVFLQRILTPVGRNLNLLLVDPSLQNPPTLSVHAVNSILAMANSSARHVLLDLNHFLGMRAVNTLSRPDVVVLTATPTLSGLRNARMLVSTLRRLRQNAADPILVLNRSGLAGRREVSVSDFRETLRLEHIIEVPFDAQLFSKAENEGKTIIELSETARASRQIVELAKLVNGTMGTNDDRGVLGSIVDVLRRWW